MKRIRIPALCLAAALMIGMIGLLSAVSVSAAEGTASEDTASSAVELQSTSISDLTAASKAFIVKWSKVSGVTGYQIQYSKNKTFASGVKTVTIEGSGKKKTSVTDLTGKKKYYVRIRTYKTVDGTDYYSDWSSVKSVTTKKKITVFAGDSIFTGLSKSSYNGVSYMTMSGTNVVLAKKSLTSYSYQTTTYSGSTTYLDKLIAYKPYRVYIMLGTNGIEYQSVSYTVDNYEDLIAEIQSRSPTTDIVILAVPPVSKSVASSRTGFKKINSLNKELKALAKEYGVHYYNYTSVFKSSGYLKSSYNGGDGIHWNLSGYKKFASLISKYDKKLESQ